MSQNSPKSNKEEEKSALFSRPKSPKPTPTIKFFSDEFVTITPIELTSDSPSEKSCYSYIGVPVQDRGKFLPNKAKALKCTPNAHYKLLTDGNSVTLEDGTIVHPF